MTLESMVRSASSLFSRAHTFAAHHTVFGIPLRESLRYASVQISTADPQGDLYVWGYIPVVVAKWSVLFSSPLHFRSCPIAVVYSSRKMVHHLLLHSVHA